jgi:hypothetical protein
MKSKAWYVKFPLDAYALGPILFDKVVGEKAVRKWARVWGGLKRLPRGFHCWPTKIWRA